MITITPAPAAATPTPPTVYNSTLADPDVNALLGAMATAVDLVGLDQAKDQRLIVNVIAIKKNGSWTASFKVVQATA